MATEVISTDSGQAVIQKRPVMSAILGTYLAASMGAAISLLLPIVAREMDYTAAQVAWILSGYLLARVSLLKLAGSLCNTVGPSRIFCLAMAVFALASFGCALVDDAALLIALRILQGAAAALISPSSLLLLEDSVPESKKAWALGWWSMAGIAGLGLAPLLGSFLMAGWGWHTLFLLSGVLAATLAILCLPRRARVAVPRQGPLIQLPDVLAAALLATAGLILGQNRIEFIAVAGTISLVLLVLARHHLRHINRPLILASLPAVASGIFGFLVITAMMLWASYFIQYDLARSAIVFGMGCAAMGVTGALSCLANNRLLARHRYDQAFLIAGILVLLVAASGVMAERAHSLSLAFLALMLTGVVYGFINSTVSGALLTVFPPANAGGGASTASLSKQFGQLAGAMCFAMYRDVTASHQGTSPVLFWIFMCGGAALIAAALWIRGQLARQRT